MSATTQSTRRRYDLTGRVQGVGFRPFVCRLAQRLGLAGYVANDASGATVEVEGPPDALDAFESDLLRELPPAARIRTLRARPIAPRSEQRFRIERSAAEAVPRAEITPDLATCRDCLRELFDPADRRHLHPLITCTQCGPRYTIVQRIPYDRPSTTMARFEMCPACRREYGDPADRRFHAQPICCPDCGPQVRFVPAPGRCPDSQRGLSPIRQAAAALRAGRIVAIKGIGGYHLACRADWPQTVAELRRRKQRETRPLALMAPDLASARRLCRLSPADEAVLTSPAAPIVLAPKQPDAGIAPQVAPGCGAFGVMLPYSPIHHLLFAQIPAPLVMTSANRSGEPLIWHDDDACALLGTLADACLTHNRPIARPLDDSVVWTCRDETIVLRRARGYVPEPIELDTPACELPLLALGGELKATFCLLRDRQAMLSEHLGDLEHARTWRHYLDAVERLEALYAVTPARIACDLHPQYLTSALARSLGLPCVQVQHHQAHIASVLAEHRRSDPVVGVACDGTGYGADRTVWGCEMLLCHRHAFRRLGHLRTFPLPGGDAAAKQTWRAAVGLLFAAFGDEWPAVLRRLAPQVFEQVAGASAATGRPAALRRVLADPRLSPRCSSLGRLFDAVAFLLGLCDFNHHEAQAAMGLEAAASGVGPVGPLPSALAHHGGQVVIEPRPMLRALLAAIGAGEPAALLAARFHETIARLLCEAAAEACRRTGVHTAALSGGCFANRLLMGRLVELLEQRGIEVLYNRRVPPGDGGVALGQAWVAAWTLAGG